MRSLILQKPFLAAFFISILISLPLSFISEIGGSKHDGYLELARNIARGYGYEFEPGGHKVFHRPPLYATLLTPGVLLPQKLWPIYVALLNSLLYSATASLITSATRRFANDSVAFWAWLIFVLNPVALYTIKNPMPPHAQTLAYVAMAAMGIHLAFRLWRREPITFSLLSLYSLVLFAGVMSHGTMLADAALSIFLLISIAIYRKNFRAIAKLFLCGLALLVLIAPWTYRNYKVTSLFLPVAGNVGVAYFAGNAHWGITAPPQQPNESTYQALIRHGGLPPETKLQYYGLTDPEAEKILNAKVSPHAISNPAAFLKKCALNAAEYFFPITYYLLTKRGLPLEPLAISLYFLALLILAAIGFRKLPFPVAAILLLLTLGYAVPYFPFLTFVGHSLYNFGTLPFLSILAAAAIARSAPSAASAPA